eukprot:755071-Hanusia_phi.AAC.2
MSSTIEGVCTLWSEDEFYEYVKRKIGETVSPASFRIIIRIKAKWEQLEEDKVVILHRSDKDEENSVFGFYKIEVLDLDECYKKFSHPRNKNPTRSAMDKMRECGIHPKNGTRGPDRNGIPKTWKSLVYYKEYIYDAQLMSSNIHRHSVNACEAFVREQVHPGTPPYKRRKINTPTASLAPMGSPSSMQSLASTPSLGPESSFPPTPFDPPIEEPPTPRNECQDCLVASMLIDAKCKFHGVPRTCRRLEFEDTNMD